MKTQRPQKIKNRKEKNEEKEKGDKNRRLFSSGTVILYLYSISSRRENSRSSSVRNRRWRRWRRSWFCLMRLHSYTLKGEADYTLCHHPPPTTAAAAAVSHHILTRRKRRERSENKRRDREREKPDQRCCEMLPPHSC